MFGIITAPVVALSGLTRGLHSWDDWVSDLTPPRRCLVRGPLQDRLMPGASTTQACGESMALAPPASAGVRALCYVFSTAWDARHDCSRAFCTDAHEAPAALPPLFLLALSRLWNGGRRMATSSWLPPVQAPPQVTGPPLCPCLAGVDIRSSPGFRKPGPFRSSYVPSRS